MSVAGQNHHSHGGRALSSVGAVDLHLGAVHGAHCVKSNLPALRDQMSKSPSVQTLRSHHARLDNCTEARGAASATRFQSSSKPQRVE